MNNTCIAFYLPQFHAIKENDEWYGKGFTEWTNVGKAKPLYKGHYQPRVPADLGYYNLLQEGIYESQVELAKEAGVAAFCFWHYWFGNGKRLLEKPVEMMLNKTSIDFPFCLAWANHSWLKKHWNPDVKVLREELLVEQTYLPEDISNQFYDILSAFRDDRYFKVDGRLLFYIYDIEAIPDLEIFMNTWNELSKKEGLPGFYFVAQSNNIDDIQSIKSTLCDAVNISLLLAPFHKLSLLKKAVNKFYYKARKIPYKDAIAYYVDKSFKEENVIPTIIPNWDHSPRQSRAGSILHGSTPELFGRHVRQVLQSMGDKKNRLIFLKSWNEWAEGNYMEPDLMYGKQYIQQLSRTLKHKLNQEEID